MKSAILFHSFSTYGKYTENSASFFPIFSDQDAKVPAFFGRLPSFSDNRKERRPSLKENGLSLQRFPASSLPRVWFFDGSRSMIKRNSRKTNGIWKVMT